MSDKVRIALIASATVIACVGMVTYCSPFQTCVRAGEAAAEHTGAEVTPEIIRLRCAGIGG